MPTLLAIAAALWLAACGCSTKPGTTPAAPAPAPGSGSATVPVTAAATTCDGLTPKLDQLYRADAIAAEPKRVDERTADNVHMVEVECAKDPGKVVACVNAAATTTDLEQKCLAPIDDEGTEGDRLAGSNR